MNEPADIPEEERPGQSAASKRYFRVLHILQLLRKRRRLLIAFLIMVLLFAAGMAVSQHWFVHAQLYETTKQELDAWAAEVTKEIGFKEKWELEGYRRASITVPRWYVVTRDGLIIDIEGFIPGLFGHVELPDESVYSAPQTVVSTVGEKWQVFGRKVTGGIVLVGICSPENASDADAKLVSNAAKFGSTLAAAESTFSREIDFNVDYAVVSSAGELKTAWGGVPLKTEAHALPLPAHHLAPLTSGGKRYLLYFRPILDSGGRQVGAVIIPKDMTMERKALQVQDRFNLWVVGIATLVACVIALWLFVQGFLGQTKRVTLEEALKVGESRTIEFKSTFQWDLRRNQYVEERRLDTLKSIAGFLNASGGTLFIGVSEDTDPPTIRGLDEDLRRAGNSKDKLQRALRDLITTRIGPEFSPFITDSLEEDAGRLYWKIVVEGSPGPAFVRWTFAGESKEQTKFYVREGPKTSDLDNESTWHYIKNKWG
jgi:hypothetical protein